MEEESTQDFEMRKMKTKKHHRLLIITSLTYAIVLAIHGIYVFIINTNYPVIISDQLVFYNRGWGVLNGLVPYRDFYTKAAPLSPYLWSIVVLFAMLFTGDWRTDIVHQVDYSDSLSMMYSSYIFRALFVVSIIAASYLLYKLLEMKKNKNSFWISLVFGINPFFLYMVSFWGTDECLLPLLIILPIYLYEKKKNYLALLTIIIGAGLKYFPIILAPLIWIYTKNWKDRILQSFLLLLGILTITLPFYLLDPTNFLLQFKNPIGSEGNQSILTIIQVQTNISLNDYSYIFTIVSAIFILLFSLLLFIKKQEWKYEKTTVLFIMFLLFYPQLQFAYTVVLFPFLTIYIFRKRMVRWVSLSALILSMISGFFANILITNTTNSLFILIIAWFVIISFYISMIVLVVIQFVNKEKNITTTVLE